MNYIKVTVNLSANELEVMRRALKLKGYTDEHDIRMAVHSIIDLVDEQSEGGFDDHNN